jgi:hypothetical protein
MISPAGFDQLAAAIVGGAEERYVSAILKRLTTSLVSGGQLQAQNWRDIEWLAQNNHAALTDLSIRYRTQIASEAQRAVTGALSASAADDLAILSTLYPSVAPTQTTALFKRLSSQTVQGVQQVIARQNIALSASAEKLWYEVAGDAVTAWNHTAQPMDRIVSDAVARLSGEGMQFVDYTSGHKTSIDAAIRRHVVSQAGQASGRITESYLDEFDHDLVFTSAHFGARPEHEVWQGKAYCRSGRKTIDGVTYPDFYRATGYGDIAGLLGVNCRHSFGPYYPGITELPEIETERNGMTSEQYYKATQHQRGLERQIRDKKREIALGQQAGLPMTQERLELGTLQNRLKGFTDSRELVRQPAREKAYGVGAQPRGLRGATIPHRTITERMGGMGDADNAVDWAVVRSESWRKKFDTLTDDADLNGLVHSEALNILKHRNNTDFEDISIVSQSKKAVVGRSTEASALGQVRYTESLKNDITLAQKRGDALVATHNHPNSFAPSFEDIASMQTRGYSRSVIACHDGSVYVIDKVADGFSTYHYTEPYKKALMIGKSEQEAAILTLEKLRQSGLVSWRELV